MHPSFKTQQMNRPGYDASPGAHKAVSCAAETLSPQHLSSSKQSCWGCCTVEKAGEPGCRVSRSQRNQWEMPQVIVIASGLPPSQVSPSPALGTPPPQPGVTAPTPLSILMGTSAPFRDHSHPIWSTPDSWSHAGICTGIVIFRCWRTVSSLDQLIAKLGSKSHCEIFGHWLYTNRKLSDTPDFLQQNEIWAAGMPQPWAVPK